MHCCSPVCRLVSISHESAAALAATLPQCTALQRLEYVPCARVDICASRRGGLTRVPVFVHTVMILSQRHSVCAVFALQRLCVEGCCLLFRMLAILLVCVSQRVVISGLMYACMLKVCVNVCFMSSGQKPMFLGVCAVVLWCCGLRRCV